MRFSTLGRDSFRFHPWNGIGPANEIAGQLEPRRIP